jgi:hypothetical protein
MHSAPASALAQGQNSELGRSPPRAVPGHPTSLYASAGCRGEGSGEESLARGSFSGDLAAKGPGQMAVEAGAVDIAAGDTAARHGFIAVGKLLHRLMV